MSTEGLTLAADFDPTTETAWRTLVEKTLRGKPFDAVMESQTYSGFALQALYSKDTAQQGPAPATRHGSWGLSVPHWNPDAKATNTAVLEDLAGGATGVAIRLQAGAFPGISIADLDQALLGVHLNMASITLIPGEEYEAGAEALLALIADRGDKPGEISGTLGIDPISTLAQTGRLLEPVEQGCHTGAEIAAAVAGKFPNLATFMADGGLYHMAGASEAQELGLMLSTGVAYLRAMESAGMDLRVAAKQISFSLSADTDILLTTAKFRAARLLWQQVLAACEVEGAVMQLDGVSSLRMVSVKDPWVNILRATAACFGAGIGGADNICILPHDTMLGMSSDFARRIARNIQIVLQEESGLSKVSDPAAGSYALESITSELSDKAWKYFNKVEGIGGIIKALHEGVVQHDMRASWAERQANLATRKDALTGISEYPNIHEDAITDVGPMPGIVGELAGSGDTVQPIEFHRLSEDFETLRVYSDACLAKDGARPSVFIANIGAATDFTARAAFAKNYFEAGGIEAMMGAGDTDLEELAAAFRTSGAKIAVLCSSDQIYAELAVGAAKMLRASGALQLYLAGRPKDADALAAAGVDEFIYQGCDVLTSLAHAHSVIGASA
jgi:methylmalonyl-CoA mutase